MTGHSRKVDITAVPDTSCGFSVAEETEHFVAWLVGHCALDSLPPSSFCHRFFALTGSFMCVCVWIFVWALSSILFSFFFSSQDPKGVLWTVWVQAHSSPALNTLSFVICLSYAVIISVLCVYMLKALPHYNCCFSSN